MSHCPPPPAAHTHRFGTPTADAIEHQPQGGALFTVDTVFPSVTSDVASGEAGTKGGVLLMHLVRNNGCDDAVDAPDGAAVDEAKSATGEGAGGAEEPTAVTVVVEYRSCDGTAHTDRVSCLVNAAPAADVRAPTAAATAVKEAWLAKSLLLEWFVSAARALVASPERSKRRQRCMCEGSTDVHHAAGKGDGGEGDGSVTAQRDIACADVGAAMVRVASAMHDVGRARFPGDTLLQRDAAMLQRWRRTTA